MNVSIPYDIITIMLRGHNVINIHYSKPDNLKNIFYLTNIISIVLLVFSGCEDALRLSLLVIVSDMYGTSLVAHW